MRAAWFTVAQFEAMVRRGEITDANGVALATSVERYVVWVDQTKIATWKRTLNGTVVAEGPAGAAEVLASAVHRLGGTVAGAGPVEVGQDVVGALLQGPPEAAQLGQRGRDAGARGRAADAVSEIAALSVRLHATLVKTGLRRR